jgi:hypothetical protein
MGTSYALAVLTRPMCIQQKQNFGTWNASELAVEWRVGLWHSVRAMANIHRHEQHVAGTS